MNERQIAGYLWDPEISGNKMVFISGPRQVGKTTCARGMLAARPGAYYNWDDPAVRTRHRSDPMFFLEGSSGGDRDYLVVFDEIHKRKAWKDTLKGMYDVAGGNCRILVTGSARLELFRRSGDSLAGRYVHYHLMPFSLAELMGKAWGGQWLGEATGRGAPWDSLVEKLAAPPEDGRGREGYEQLFRFGGFPEPLFRGSDRFLFKWRGDLHTQILTEDLRQITNVRQVDVAEKIASLLPERVGSPLSLASLARDVESSFPTVKNHLLQMKKLWLLFFLRPFSGKLARTLRQEEKCYFADWTAAAVEAKVFENFLGSVLMRACTVWSDLGLGKAELWYVKNFDGVELDFLLTWNGRPMLAVEAKLSDTAVSAPARNLAARLKVPLVQAIHRGGIFLRPAPDVLVVSADRLMGVLP